MLHLINFQVYVTKRRQCIRHSGKVKVGSLLLHMHPSIVVCVCVCLKKAVIKMFLAWTEHFVNILYLIYRVTSNHLNHSTCLPLFITHDNPNMIHFYRDVTQLSTFLHPGLSTKQKWQLEESSFGYAAKLDLNFF